MWSPLLRYVILGKSLTSRKLNFLIYKTEVNKAHFAYLLRKVFKIMGMKRKILVSVGIQNC